MLGLGTPNLCADVKAWAADGYRALPASIVTFSGKFMPAWVALGYLPKQLGASESSADRALARRCEPLEELLTEGEARAVAHYGEIMNTLEIGGGLFPAGWARVPPWIPMASSYSSSTCSRSRGSQICKASSKTGALKDPKELSASLRL